MSDSPYLVSALFSIVVRSSAGKLPVPKWRYSNIISPRSPQHKDRTEIVCCSILGAGCVAVFAYCKPTGVYCSICFWYSQYKLPVCIRATAPNEGSCYTKWSSWLRVGSYKWHDVVQTIFHQDLHTTFLMNRCPENVVLSLRRSMHAMHLRNSLSSSALLVPIEGTKNACCRTGMYGRLESCPAHSVEFFRFFVYVSGLRIQAIDLQYRYKYYL
jgi:hypothetical protein